ncbi:(2Fe-2S)-binding protein [Streptomyces sp. 3MP-14]|uniref:(2Fe-2S)-binding protein n=1 Tax=Streptomyces mimosae TaxID=2586635 RepID=A0A5N6AQA0_9ACTN|nr:MULTISPECIES: (2Fe-2S)-binding protein [Streptomyces]KAB8169879.1 (2Fe-2S)-binding protein [Streptomyces mimosae]KAB8178627.1 (2Fe-2S)-binding protein [Streptomyces sp. 3MP-14]
MNGAGEGQRAERPLTIHFEGRPLPARAGQTVGGALLAAGVVSWRTTRGGGRPRGLFCGIGLCFDCLISVDGGPPRRACVEPVTDGMRLTPAGGVVGAAVGADGAGGGAGAGGGGAAGDGDEVEGESDDQPA